MKLIKDHTDNYPGYIRHWELKTDKDKAIADFRYDRTSKDGYVNFVRLCLGKKFMVGCIVNSFCPAQYSKGFYVWLSYRMIRLTTGFTKKFDFKIHWSGSIAKPYTQFKVQASWFFIGSDTPKMVEDYLMRGRGKEMDYDYEDCMQDKRDILNMES